MTECTKLQETSKIDFLALKSKLNRDSRDKDSIATQFPLWAVLSIYSKAEHDCYINYMEGFKLLAEWLYPICPPNIEDIYSNILDNYVTNEISHILNISRKDIISSVILQVIPRYKNNIASNQNELR